jgi:hypothetical protein
MQELAELSAETRDVALSRFRLLESHLEQHRSSRQTREFPFGRRKFVGAVTPNSEQTFTPHSALTYRLALLWSPHMPVVQQAIEHGGDGGAIRAVGEPN